MTAVRIPTLAPNQPADTFERRQDDSGNERRPVARLGGLVWMYRLLEEGTYARLSRTARQLTPAVAIRAGHDGELWATTEHFAALTGLGVRSVQIGRSELVKAALLQRAGSANPDHFVVHLPFDPAPTLPLERGSTLERDDGSAQVPAPTGASTCAGGASTCAAYKEEKKRKEKEKQACPADVVELDRDARGLLDVVAVIDAAHGLGHDRPMDLISRYGLAAVENAVVLTRHRVASGAGSKAIANPGGLLHALAAQFARGQASVPPGLEPPVWFEPPTPAGGGAAPARDPAAAEPWLRLVGADQPPLFAPEQLDRLAHVSESDLTEKLRRLGLSQAGIGLFWDKRHSGTPDPWAESVLSAAMKAGARLHSTPPPERP